MFSLLVMTDDVHNVTAIKLITEGKAAAVLDMTLVLLAVSLIWLVADLFAKCKTCCSEEPALPKQRERARVELIPRDAERSDAT